MPPKSTLEPSTPDWHRFTLGLSQQDTADLRDIARRRGAKFAVLVREAVRFWLDDQRQQQRRAS